MADRSISQEDVNNLIEDARYLQDEMEALQYVIEEIPYSQEHPTELSIAEMLYRIDHAQKYYYKPVLEKVKKISDRIVDVRRLGNYQESFEFEKIQEKDIQEKLQKIVKHRAALVSAMESITFIDWKQSVETREGDIQLFKLLQNMVHHERSVLKKIADRVLVHSKEKHEQRSMKNKGPDN